MAKYIVAHDVGTSGNKAVLVDTEGHVHGKCFEPYRTYHPSPGWVEQESQDWWRAVRVPPTIGFNWDGIRNPYRSV
jgi:xylulokinase